MAGNNAATFTWVYFAGYRCAFIALAAHFIVFLAVAAMPSSNAGGSHTIAPHACGTVGAWGSMGCQWQAKRTALA